MFPCGYKHCRSSASLIALTGRGTRDLQTPGKSTTLSVGGSDIEVPRRRYKSQTMVVVYYQQATHFLVGHFHLRINLLTRLPSEFITMRWTLAACVLVSLQHAADAGCTDAKFIDGRLHALCTDEVTGFDFEYIDFDGVFNQVSGRLTPRGVAIAADAGLNDEVYAWYEDATNATEALATTGDIEPRGAQLVNMWNRCKRGIAGACGRDHVIAWHGVAQAFIGNVVAIAGEIATGVRENKSPRSICHK